MFAGRRACITSGDGNVVTTTLALGTELSCALYSFDSPLGRSRGSSPAHSVLLRSALPSSARHGSSDSLRLFGERDREAAISYARRRILEHVGVRDALRLWPAARNRSVTDSTDRRDVDGNDRRPRGRRRCVWRARDFAADWCRSAVVSLAQTPEMVVCRARSRLGNRNRDRLRHTDENRVVGLPARSARRLVPGAFRAIGAKA